MADIKLGLNREAIDGARDTYDGPRTPFPATKAGYTKYSAIVSDLQIKQGNGANAHKAWLWIQVSNGAYLESILVNLDPSDIAPTTAPDKVEAAVKRNLDTLLRAIKVLNIANATGDGIDTSKFEAAKGAIVSFGVKLGDQQANGYYKYYTSFYGKAESLVPIAGGEVIGGAASAPVDDDVPF